MPLEESSLTSRERQYLDYIESEIKFAKKERYHGSISLKVNFHDGEIKNILNGVEKSVKF